MLMRTFCIAGIFLGLAATAALPNDYPATSASSSAVAHHGNHHGVRIPRELRLMWRQEMRPKMKALPKGERHGWLKARWEEMTDRERNAKIIELRTKWNSLPAKVRERLLEKRQQKHAARHEHRAGRRGGKQDNGSEQPRP